MHLPAAHLAPRWDSLPLRQEYKTSTSHQHGIVKLSFETNFRQLLSKVHLKPRKEHFKKLDQDPDKEQWLRKYFPNHIIIAFFFFFCLLSFVFSGLYSQHMEVPNVGGLIRAVAASLWLQWGIRAVSMTYTTAQGNSRSLTHWARPGIKPAAPWFPVRFVNHWATTGTPNCSVFKKGVWWSNWNTLYPCLLRELKEYSNWYIKTNQSSNEF